MKAQFLIFAITCTELTVSGSVWARNERLEFLHHTQLSPQSAGAQAVHEMQNPPWMTYITIFKMILNDIHDSVRNKFINSDELTKMSHTLRFHSITFSFEYSMQYGGWFMCEKDPSWS